MTVWTIQSSGDGHLSATNEDGRVFSGTVEEYRAILDNDRAMETQQKLRDEAIALGGKNLDVGLEDSTNVKESF